MNGPSHTLPAAVPRTRSRAAQWLLRTGRAGVTVRVAQPSDIGPLQQWYATLSLQTRAQRFFSPLRELPREMLKALESGDPAHRFLVVEGPEAEGNDTLLGLGQYAVVPGQAHCELALLIADDWQGCGLGRRLLDQLLQDAVASGLRQARLETLHGNLAMRALARRAGFSVRTHPEDSLLLLGCRALAGQDHHPGVWSQPEPSAWCSPTALRFRSPFRYGVTLPVACRPDSASELT
jgi:GNAT superfamily N-acetyltransferase